MRSRRRFVYRVAVAAAVMAVAVLGFTGCSMVSPESSWTGSEGSISGTVSSDGGSALAGIDVRMYGQAAGGESVDYCATTDANGSYSVDCVELGGPHAYEMDYVIYVNRTASSAVPIVTNYGTHVATVSVATSGSSYDAVILSQSPGLPDDLYE